MYTLKTITNHQLFVIILFLIPLLFGCATEPAHKYEYEELENSYDSIYEGVKPGMSISIKAKDISGTFILIGYENNDTLICVDESGEVSAKTKIAIDDIESIHLRERVWDTDYSYADRQPHSENFFGNIAQTVLFFALLLGFILVL